MRTNDDHRTAEADRSAADDQELRAISDALAPIIQAGKARGFLFALTRALLVTFQRPNHGAFTQTMLSLARWLTHAETIDEQRTVRLHPEGMPLVMNDVYHAADLTAARLWAHMNAPIPIESWITYDVAVTLRRACECTIFQTSLAERTLLPLALRDARRLCVAAKMPGDEIEAVVARFGGRPS